MRRFETSPAPHLPVQPTVSLLMIEVLSALIPATLVYVWYFGPGLLFNIAVAVGFAVASEAAMLRLRGRPVMPWLGDGSAVVAAVLFAFTLPPLTPWWITAVGVVFAMVVAKHLYGGLGFNLFNPAMAGYAVVLISFPVHMTNWLPPVMGDLDYSAPGVLETFFYTLTGRLPGGESIDALTRATPLDAVRTGLGEGRFVSEITAGPMFGDFGGRGWEWINNWIALGGLYLLWRGVIRWHIPVAMIGTMLALATVSFVIYPDQYPGPGFHLFTGATLLGAFFIATDPVSAAASTTGRLVFGAGIGALTWIIRTWGGYPDGVAFAVLLMNMAVPLIDRYTRPRIYGT